MKNFACENNWLKHIMKIKVSKDYLHRTDRQSFLSILLAVTFGLKPRNFSVLLFRDMKSYNIKREHKTHLCIALKPVFTRNCKDRLHFNIPSGGGRHQESSVPF